MTEKPRALTLFGVATCMLLPPLTMTSITTALPTMGADLGGMSGFSWVVSAYLITATVSVPLSGKLSDLYGRKPLLRTAIIGFVLASLLGGAAQSMWQVAGARAVQGVFGGSIMALAQAVIGEIVTPRERGKYQGYIGGVFAFAAVVGPLVGGILVDLLSWRFVFFTNVPFGLFSLWIVTRHLRLPRVTRERSIDWGGAILLTAGSTALLVICVLGGTVVPWASPTVVAMASVAGLCTVGLVALERRVPEPLLPPRLFTNPVFTVGSVIGFLAGALIFTTVTLIPWFLQGVSGMSPTLSGVLLGPLILGMVTTTVVSGRLITRWGRYKVFPMVGAIVVVVGYVLLSGIEASTSFLEMSAHMIVIGLGSGMIVQTVVIAIQNSVEYSDFGSATASTVFVRLLGGALGVAASGAVVNNRLQAAMDEALTSQGLPLDARELIESPELLATLPATFQQLYRTELAEGLASVFALGIPVAVLACVGAALLREHPLSDRLHVADGGAQGSEAP